MEEALELYESSFDVIFSNLIMALDEPDFLVIFLQELAKIILFENGFIGLYRDDKSINFATLPKTLPTILPTAVQNSTNHSGVNHGASLQKDMKIFKNLAVNSYLISTKNQANTLELFIKINQNILAHFCFFNTRFNAFTNVDIKTLENNIETIAMLLKKYRLKQDLMLVKDAQQQKIDILKTALALMCDKKLTAREFEVLTYLINGERNRAIAKILAVSENTLKKHCKKIYYKMGVQSKNELLLGLAQLFI